MIHFDQRYKGLAITWGRGFQLMTPLFVIGKRKGAPFNLSGLYLNLREFSVSYVFAKKLKLGCFYFLGKPIKGFSLDMEEPVSGYYRYKEEVIPYTAKTEAVIWKPRFWFRSRWEIQTTITFTRNDKEEDFMVVRPGVSPITILKEHLEMTDELNGYLKG